MKHQNHSLMLKISRKIYSLSKNDLFLVFTQFILILLHLLNLNKYPQKSNIEYFDFLGNSFILLGSILIIFSIKELRKHISPMPKPKENSILITNGIYSKLRHPMYYALIIISIGFLLKNLSIYNLTLTLLLGMVIKCKIKLEEEYLINKFKKYKTYRINVKF